MKWYKLEIRLPKDHKQWFETKASIMALTSEMIPRKCKSTIWYRTLTHGGSNVFTFEMLIPALTEEHKLIIEQLGYDICPFTIRKFDRRKHFHKLEKNDNRTK